MEIISANSVSLAWLDAVRLLERSNREAWDLIVEIKDPLAGRNAAIETALSHELTRRRHQSLETVASTIFPQSVWATSHENRECLYGRYLRIVPRLRRFPGNSRGTYFERLVRWPPGRGPYNQLEEVIQRLVREFGGRGRNRVVYDLLLFSPTNDPRPLGFPCLAYVNVKVAQGRLRMTAHYRNHWFVAKAYGNYVGLARLQRFIAEQAGLEVGELVCISGHAQVESSPVRILKALGRA